MHTSRRIPSVGATAGSNRKTLSISLLPISSKIEMQDFRCGAFDIKHVRWNRVSMSLATMPSADTCTDSSERRAPQTLATARRATGKSEKKMFASGHDSSVDFNQAYCG